MDMSQYMEIFIEESKENLQNLNQSILQLEQVPNDKKLLNEIFRVAHTLKGMTGTMGFSRMAKLTHAMENVLDGLRSGEQKVSTKIIDLMFKCFDALEDYLQNIINYESEGENEYKDIIKELNKVLAGGEESKVEEDEEKTGSGGIENPTSIMKPDEFELKAISRAFEMQLKVFRITIVLNKSCVLKAARSFIVFQTLEKYSEIIKSQPAVKEIEDEKFEYDITVLVISKYELEVLKKELNQIAEINKIIIKDIKNLDEADNSTEAANVKAGKTEIKTVTKKEVKNIVTEVLENAQEKSMEQKTEQATKKAKASNKTVRVGIGRLDTLMNLVSELIIIKTRLEGLNDFERTQNYNEAVEYFERVTTSLHEIVMQVRMVPVETVFNRFPRMIRDVAKDIGKEIVLEMSGEETELDRTVIDEIGDPLIHLLRNSADHGIESPQEREDIGKPAAGHIFLRAYQAGNSVIIEVEDDGGGINVERVRQKIIEKKIIPLEEANSLNKNEVIDYLFKPSFSTADKVTSLSGRGVGLDVVKTKIETLGGQIEVDTELGKGSKFRIILPLTLAIIQALLVKLSDEKYAIPLSNIQEVIKVNVKDIKFVQKKEVIVLREEVIPIIRLKNRLKVEGETLETKLMNVVIVRKGDKLAGFVIDSMIGQSEVVIKSLGKLLSGIKNIAGATILGDGEVALIIDINSLI